MKKPYLINFPEHKCEPIEPLIIAYIREHHKEYLSSEAGLTKGFVNIVLCASSEVIGLPDLYIDLPNEAAAVYEALNKKTSELLSAATIRMILDTSDALAFEIFMEDELRKTTIKANMTCIACDDYAARADARFNMRRLADAFDDYNRACSIHPWHAGFRMKRASLCLETGMLDLAYQDLLFAYDRTIADVSSSTGIINSLLVLIDFVLLFRRCGQPGMVAGTALRFQRIASELLKYPLTFCENEMIEIRDAKGFSGSVNLNSMFEDVGKTLEEILSGNGDGPVDVLVQQAFLELIQCTRQFEERLGLL